MLLNVMNMSIVNSAFQCHVHSHLYFHWQNMPGPAPSTTIIATASETSPPDAKVLVHHILKQKGATLARTLAMLKLTKKNLLKYISESLKHNIKHVCCSREDTRWL